MEALHEIQAAHFLGYRRISDFRRDLRQGHIPSADRELPSGPIWSRARLQSWLDRDQSALSILDERNEALRRVTSDQGKNPLSRA